MILRWEPWKMIVLGIAMMLLSMLLPWLMVLHLIKSTIFLNFLAYGLSVAGMLIGFLGIVHVVKIRRNQDDKYD